ASLKSAVDAMLSIGGYLLFFSLLNVIPEILLGRAVLELSPLLEITTGLVRIGNAHPLYSLACFTFGGLSCMAQTKACLRTSELKDFMTEYVFHKCVLTLVCTAYFFFLEFLPDFPT
ncbi:MAG: hypothetical protein IKS85_10195, partial [Lachnospiraceae bacterium]|nr:hypothetical protein [Lachnospiraceae bacterium]